MDCLTFGTPIQIWGLNSKKDPINQISLEKILEGFELSMEEFIDLCILLGCDYTKTIKGIGLVKAFKYIQEKKTIEKVIE